jgi:aspartate dehydrogenase
MVTLPHRADTGFSSMSPCARTVAIGGIGAIGLTIAEWLDRNSGALQLAAVSARDLGRAQEKVASFKHPPLVVVPGDLSKHDIVVEAAPADAFDSIAIPAVEAGRTLIVASVGALLSRPEMIGLARRTGAKIMIPSGALAGLDGIRGAAAGRIETVILETRKLPSALAGAPYLMQRSIDVTKIVTPTCVFRGNALEAASGFPANANVAAALALAGIGAVRTTVEIWADPNALRNTHKITVDADCGHFTIEVQATRSARNPRTSQLAPQSIIACLQSLYAPLKVGG